jgi:hypothetical protein
MRNFFISVLSLYSSFYVSVVALIVSQLVSRSEQAAKVSKNKMKREESGGFFVAALLPRSTDAGRTSRPVILAPFRDVRVR